MTNARELRTAFHEAMLRHGGRRTGGHYTVPAGEPVNGRQPWLSFRINPNGYGPSVCTIVLDRWNATEPPESARDWLRDHIHPYIDRAVNVIRKGNWWMTLPGTSSYTSATILRTDLLAVLDSWIPQEKQWQQEAQQ